MSEKQYQVTFTAPEQAELLEIEPDTRPLDADEVIGRTVVSLVSAGTETTGAYSGAMGMPINPGYACVFEVTEVGSEAKKIKVGDLVYSSGQHRSHQRDREPYVLQLPQGLAPQAGVFARLMGVSMSTLVTTTARPPDRVLVTGLGPVGNLAAQLFQACGYRVVASDPQASRCEIAKAVGLDARMSVPLDDPTIADHIQLVLECSGHEQAVLDGCSIVRKRGEVVLIGVPWRKRTDIAAFEILHKVFHRYVTIRSGWEWDVPALETDYKVGSLMANYEAGLRWLNEGKVRVEGLYTLASPRDAQAVYQDILRQRSKALTTIFNWTTEL